MPLRLAHSSRVLAMAVAAIGGPAALAVPASAAARRSLHRAPRSLTLNCRSSAARRHIERSGSPFALQIGGLIAAGAGKL